MIATGAQIRAARGMLGWSQEDLAKATGLPVNAIRYYERQHGRKLHFTSSTGYASEQMTDAFRKAGLVLMYDPPGVAINPDLYKPNAKPPIFKRWEKQWRLDSKASVERVRRLNFARSITGNQNMRMADALDWYEARGVSTATIR